MTAQVKLSVNEVSVGDAREANALVIVLPEGLASYDILVSIAPKAATAPVPAMALALRDESHAAPRELTSLRAVVDFLRNLTPALDLKATLRDVERELLLKALSITSGDRPLVAVMLRTGMRRLRERIKSHRISDGEIRRPYVARLGPAVAGAGDVLRHPALAAPLRFLTAISPEPLCLDRTLLALQALILGRAAEIARHDTAVAAEMLGVPASTLTRCLGGAARAPRLWLPTYSSEEEGLAAGIAPGTPADPPLPHQPDSRSRYRNPTIPAED